MAQDEYCVHVDFAYDIKCKRMSEKNKNKKNKNKNKKRTDTRSNITGISL
jgi:hypothetical protein